MTGTEVKQGIDEGTSKSLPVRELDLQLIIIRHCHPLSGKLIIPNIFGLYGEMDVLRRQRDDGALCPKGS